MVFTNKLIIREVDKNTNVDSETILIIQCLVAVILGLIASVGMMPIFVLELIGVAYNISLKINANKEHRKAIRISYGIDRLSNIEALEEAYNRREALKVLEKENRFVLEEEIMLAQQLKEFEEIKENNNEVEG